MQEFLASYAVKVDEDGARRLQRILEQNRTAAKELSTAFTAANTALNALKKNLADASGLKNVLSSLISGSSVASSSLPSVLSALSSSLTGSSLSGGGGSGLSGGASVISIRANLSEAEEALSSFRARLEAERPKLNVNATGITSAVSSAIASIRSMMSSVWISVPVTAVATLTTSGIKTTTGSTTGTTTSPTVTKPSATTSGGKTSASSSVLTRLGIGGRVASPTLAMIAEEGEPEYVIPLGNESRAVSLLRSLFSELSESARLAVFGGNAAGDAQSAMASDDSGSFSALFSDFFAASRSALPLDPFSLDASLSARLSDLSAAARSALLPTGAASPVSSNTIQAPVNIHVTASGTNAEAVGCSIYDTAQRSLLKTLKGVFA